MTIGESYKQLSLLLQAVYEPREARNIASLIMENITGFANSERVVHQHESMNDGQQNSLQQMTTELLAYKPVQYVLHEAHWYKMKLYVDEHVLIPRQETEELVEWITEEVKGKASRIKNQETRFKMEDANIENQTSMLDVGTGSGCIAIALKKNLPKTKMWAADVSEEALHVAKQNALANKAEIEFIMMNALETESWKALPALDYIISNPPYIAQSEAHSMNDNVLKHEPHLALFVPDDNPLLFYEAISKFGWYHLKNGGKLFFEINESFGEEVAHLLSTKGYQNIELKKDLQGKNRMMKGEKAEAPPPLKGNL